ncbi:uncharacterized protein [Populus alba]|uniref:uncharacterized protein n=1 Tax=Populus alba TaxID=43335 RepID=UPI003CC6EB85
MSDHFEESASTAHKDSSNIATLNLSDDSSSCYYLHPSDNPGALLVLEIFTGENYIAWSKSMTIALTVKNKIAFIDGSLVQPNTTNQSLRMAWLRSNNLNSKSITEYFSEFKALWDEYNSYRPIPSCKCGHLDSCSCNIFKHLTARQQSDFVMKFLVGLHDSYSSVRSQLLLQTPLPSMGRVFSLLLQEESQRSLTNAAAIPIDCQAMIAEHYHNQNSKSGSNYTTRFAKYKGKTKATCTHCGYPGHIVDKCFQLIGYPPGWKGPRGKRLATMPHTSKNFQRLPTAHHTTALQPHLDTPNIVFSQEQMQNLLTLANSISSSKLNNTATEVSTSGISFSCHTASSPHNSFSWILDTGATDHMICSPLLFESIILPKTQNNVHLPNGQHVPILFTRTIRFSPDIILYNALYVPAFNINLISVSRLTAANIVGLFFLHTKCILQDLSKWKMIGLAEAESGLYKLHKPPAPNATKSPLITNIKSCAVATNIWHLRLGHIPPSKIALLNKTDPSVHTPLVFPDYPQHFDPFPCRPSNTTLHDSVVPTTIPIQPSVPHISTLPPPLTQLRKSERTKHPPTYLTQYYCGHMAQIASATPDSSPCFLPGKPYSILSYLSTSHLSLPHCAFTSSVSSIYEPKTYKQASSIPHWQHAMTNEITALEKNQTWDLVILPPNKTVIGCKWVYKVKFQADGQVERYKARLVAKGYTQQEGIDFFDTFSPVAKITTVRVLLTIAAANNWHLHQFDVDNAFLHGDLHEEVFMQLPPSYSNHNDPRVCKLKKSIYGLKQASRQWFSKLSASLLQFGFLQANSDSSLFIKQSETTLIAILIYVDNVLIASNDLTALTIVKNYLRRIFPVKDLGHLKYFLGIEVARSTKGIVLCQRKYALDILMDSGFSGAKPVTFPMESTLKLSTHDTSPPLPNPASYRRLIGRLLYLTLTRPDLSYAIQTLSQFMSNPHTLHMQAAERVLRYLKATPGKGLLLKAASPLHLKAYSDSDWGGCIDTRRSVTGYLVFLGDSLISWKSKKQPTVSRSSCRSRISGHLATTSCELQWHSYLLADFHIPHSQPALLYTDSKPASEIAYNPIHHERTKHIQIDCHLVREKLQAGLLTIIHIPSKFQLADALTKPLGSHMLNPLLDKMGMINIHSHLAGGYWNIAHAPTEANAANNSSILAEQATPAADSPTPEDSRRLAMIS